MPDLIDSQAEEDRALVLEVLADAAQSETEIAISAGISLSATNRALGSLALSGRVIRSQDNGTYIWSRC
jgi:DNA-binding GntR family transcriptional regulator